MLRYTSSLGLLGRLEDECLVDVRDHTTASDGGLDKGVELLIASDCQLKVAGSNSLHLKVLRCVSCEFEDLSGQVLEDSSSVDC